MNNRTIAQYASRGSGKGIGRILVLTGARETGKKTLARHLFPSHAYVSIEDPVTRGDYARLTAAQWNLLYPHAILDEVQKQPPLIESIKSVYDLFPDPTYVLLSSSQFLLLEKVKESLAGRCRIIELYPLTLPELESSGWDEAVQPSLFQQCLLDSSSAQKVIDSFLPSFNLDPLMARKDHAWRYYVRYGGYPALTDIDMSDKDRWEWLAMYVKTYLERDIRDLAEFRDLDPFVRMQRYLAQQTARTVNASAISQEVGVSVKTVQKYLNYFELNYQTIMLPSWKRNVNKRLTKTPKLHFLDNGVLQAVLRKQGGVTGHEFESLVVAEMFKQIKCLPLSTSPYHLRTHDGKEVDLLLETSEGYFAFEIKMSDHSVASDAKHLRSVEAILDKPLLHAFVLSNDPVTRTLGDGITAVNVAYFLG
ncbi:MAG: ATP-binding protein [Sphaerochaeta sp.]|nr:ATP-binding protein [Sphaerochaeta sp.]